MKHYYWTIELHGEADTPEEAWDFALEGFMQARIPAPEPDRIEIDPDQDDEQ